MSRILALVLLLGFPLSIETELQGQSSGLAYRVTRRFSLK